jgi:uncharacterized damage-inducible protein DinB
MMVRSPSEISKFLAYNRWANARMLEPVTALSAEKLRRELGGSFGSLHGTLTHLYGGEWIWLQRARGFSPKALPTNDDVPTADALRAKWRVLEDEIAEFAKDLTPASLARTITYTNFVGTQWTYTLSDVLFDLVNHSTYHRGQVATLLRQLGETPVSTDYVRFLDGDGLAPPDRMPGEIVRLFAYNRWANMRVLRAARGITAEEYSRTVGGSFTTLRDTLTHVYGADWVWLERFAGRSPRALPAGKEAGSPNALETMWREVEEGWAALVGEVESARMRERLDYVAFSGDAFSRPIGDVLVHVVNHSTYHRGQVATLTRQLGKQPASTDYLMMLDERG